MPFPESVPLLTDGVVTLRAHRPDDVPRIVEQCTDPETVVWTTVPQPYGVAQAETFLDDVVPGAWGSGAAAYFAIEHDGRFAGTIDLRFGGPGEAEVGFGLHPDARGHGVMRRALLLALDWAYDEREIAVVTWRAQAGNWASRRVAWSVGFRFGPTVPTMLAQRGERRDAWIGWLGREDPRDPTTTWLEPVPLADDVVRMRAWRSDDGPRLVEAAHDPELQARIPRSPLPLTVDGPQGVEDYLMQVRLRAATGERVAWCVTDPATDLALGNVAVFDFSRGSAELGFWSHPEGRGRGVVSRAAALAAGFALDQLGVRRLDLLTGESNLAARAVAERVGFTLVGSRERACRRPTGGRTWRATSCCAPAGCGCAAPGSRTSRGLTCTTCGPVPDAAHVHVRPGPGMPADLAERIRAREPS